MTRPKKAGGGRAGTKLCTGLIAVLFDAVMLKKALAMTTLAFGATLAISGTAHAEPNGDPAKYFDVTADFMPADTPDALSAKEQGKNLIMSPYGTSHTIACRGTSAADVYDCMQEDALGWITLSKVEVPGIGTTWVYLP